jgi:hypothetical protein
MLLSSVVSATWCRIYMFANKTGSMSLYDEAEATLEVLRTVADALLKFVCIQKWAKKKK